ncbi:OmpA family protein [Spirillospora sp. NPDC127200]
MIAGRRGASALSLLAAAALAAAGCSDGSKPAPSTSASPGTTGASASPGGAPARSSTLMEDPNVSVELVGLSRASDKVVVARLKLVNRGASSFIFGSPFMPTHGDLQSVSGITLLDGAGLRRHYPLVGTDGKCLCTRTLLGAVVPAQGTKEIVAAYPAPPAGVQRMTIAFPNAAPMTDVPIGGPVGGTIALDDKVAVDPAATPTGPPEVLPVIATVESPDGAEDDNGTDLSVRLSADVLFALNKADLNPRAHAILKEVAAKIDKSPGSTVRVDGHTDNSGNDAINEPLSERRARSVEAELKKSVTRTGLSYAVKGHGSKQPTASNDTEAGRKANRRVTVSFARPKPPAPSPAPAPAGSGAAPAPLTLQATPPTGYTEPWPRDITATIDSLRRSADGHVTLTWTVANQGQGKLSTALVFSGGYGTLYQGLSTNGAILTSGKLNYRVLRDTRNETLGPNLSKMEPKGYTVEPNEKVTFSAVFKPPAELKAVDVTIPAFGTAKDVAVE